MTFHEWQTFARGIHARTDRLRERMTDEARRTCKAAGLDPMLLGIHPHNAMCSLEQGRPWPEVDYRLCRRTLWLIERSFEPGAMASRIIDRAWRKVSR